MIDSRSAASWRSVRAVRRSLRREAELRYVRPGAELGVVWMCLALIVVIGVGWWILG